jgi:RNA polymerase sigma factor (sigma-70 family)
MSTSRPKSPPKPAPAQPRGGVKVIVTSQLYTVAAAENYAPPAQLPRAVGTPPDQPPEGRDAFIAWLERRWGAYIDMKLRRPDILPESAKDLRQQVLVILCEKHEKEEAPPKDVPAFLGVVLKYVIANHQRRWKADVDAGADVDAAHAAAPSPESAAARAEMLEKIQRYAAHLTQEQLEVLEAREVHGLSLEEVAAARGCSVAAVFRTHARALRTLQDKARASERAASLAAYRSRFRK